MRADTSLDKIPEEDADDSLRKSDISEPKKPGVGLEQTFKNIEAELEKEEKFLLGVMLTARDIEMTNNPFKLFKMYKEEKANGRIPSVWGKGDQSAENLIKDYYSDEFILKRIIILHEKKMSSAGMKKMSIFGFY